MATNTPCATDRTANPITLITDHLERCVRCSSWPTTRKPTWPLRSLLPARATTSARRPCWPPSLSAWTSAPIGAIPGKVLWRKGCSTWSRRRKASDERQIRQPPAICPEADLFDLEDYISTRMSKARAVLAILVVKDQFKALLEDHLTHALWAMQGLVEEADTLQGILWEKLKRKQ